MGICVTPTPETSTRNCAKAEEAMQAKAKKKVNETLRNALID